MQIALAPMEGLVDEILRDVLTRVGGIDWCVTEFIRVTDRLHPLATYEKLAPELLHGSRTRAGTPMRVQFLGSDPQCLAENAAYACELGAPVIDLFCGHYTVSPGAGAILFGSLPTPTVASLFDSEAGRATLVRLSELMRAEAERDADGSAAIMSAFCTVLIALVLRTVGGPGSRMGAWTAVPDPNISAAIRGVLARPGDDWSIGALSTRAAMSRATFIRRFQAATGMTFGAFLTRARLMTAADLLVGSEWTVSAVAAHVGYRSESAFTRAFRAAVGETPARFRRSASVRPSSAGNLALGTDEVAVTAAGG